MKKEKVRVQFYGNDFLAAFVAPPTPTLPHEGGGS